MQCNPPAGSVFAKGFDWASVRYAPRQVKSFADLRYGKGLVTAVRRPGEVPVYGTNGQCGWHDRSLSSGPGVILGRKGQGHLGVEWSARPFWVIDTAYYADLDSEQADPRWFYYITKYVGLDHLKTGEKPGLSRELFLRQLFPFPSLDEQRQIGRTLGAIDERIHVNDDTNRTLEATAQAIFKSWFVDFDPVVAKSEGRRPFGMNAKTAALFPKSFGESDLGPLPCGWSLRPVSDLIEGLYDGPHATPPTADKGPVFLGIKNMTGTQIDHGEVRHISEDDWPRWTRRVTPGHGDIVFTYEAALGLFALIPPDLRCCLGRRMALVRLRNDLRLPHFLFHWFVSEPFQELLDARSVQGSTVNRIPLLDFPKYPVVWPSEELARRFEGLAEPIWARIHDNQQQIEVLSETLDVLLPRLLSGEIRIKAAERLLAEVT